MPLPCGTFNDSYDKEFAIVRTRLQWGLLALLFVLMGTLPLFVNVALLGWVNMALVTLVAVLGLQILTGYCGQISVGHSAFMAVGAYSAGILASRLGWPFWACIPAAALITGVVGVLFGLPSLRVKGFYLIMATLAAQIIITWTLIHWAGVTGGVMGLDVPPARLGNIEFMSDFSCYYIIMPVAALMTFFAKNLVRTRVGRCFIAIRDNDLAAEVMGVSLWKYKILAFFIGCLFAGVAGGLWAFWLRAITVEQFTFTMSVWMLGMVIVGGMGSILGAVLGTIFIKALDEGMAILGPMIGNALPAMALNISTSLSLVVFGLVLILFLIYEPRGLAHRWEIFKASYRVHPFSY